MNNATGKEAAVAEENHDDEKIAAKGCDNDDFSFKGHELVTAVQGHCVEDVVAKEGMVEQFCVSINCLHEQMLC